ncbi:MAG TPA: DinB superfamily protein [Ignavibacteriales bacterium]|nr:DinB superfamily protein [Ignavibacteriales bacterium]
MLKESIIEILIRDLNKLKDEISLYKDETSLWIIKNEINNSAGNLCLHLIGNLNHFIGALLGNTGYVRNRENEFSAKNILRTELYMEIDRTNDVISNSLLNLSKEDFEKDFPSEKHGKIVKTDYMLLHLITHFNYHLGQINYHRRLINN